MPIKFEMTLSLVDRGGRLRLVISTMFRAADFEDLQRGTSIACALQMTCKQVFSHISPRLDNKAIVLSEVGKSLRAFLIAWGSLEVR